VAVGAEPREAVRHKEGGTSLRSRERLVHTNESLDHRRRPPAPPLPTTAHSFMSSLQDSSIAPGHLAMSAPMLFPPDSPGRIAPPPRWTGTTTLIVESAYYFLFFFRHCPPRASLSSSSSSSSTTACAAWYSSCITSGVAAASAHEDVVHRDTLSSRRPPLPPLCSYSYLSDLP